MNKKKWIYIGILIVVVAIVSIASFSYAFLTHVDEQHGKINVIAGTLDYRIESSDLDTNNSIILTGTKTIDIDVVSLNEISSKYELYYTSTNDDVVVEYIDSSDKDKSVGETIAYERKHIQVRITTTNEATITFGVRSGFVYNELALDTNENSLIGVEIVLPPTITGGSSNWVTASTTISISEEGYASKGIDHYEYYVTQSGTLPTDTTTVTGTGDSIKVTTEGTSYVYFRTVSTTENKSEWSNPQIIKIDTSKWRYFLAAANYNQGIYNSFSEAMNTASITNSIFSNTSAMNYLVSNQDLLSEMKTLSNYSSTLVSKLLATNVYNQAQKYNYGLPFYLYNQGSYDTNYLNFTTSKSTVFNTGPETYEYKNAGTYAVFTSTQYPNACTSMYGQSTIPISITKYNSLKINVTYYTNTFSNHSVFGVSPGQTKNPVYYTPVSTTGVISVGIQGVEGNYLPTIYSYKCYGAHDGTKYLNYSQEIRYDKMWLE